jgi:excisionase family DNA binding protein
MSTTRPADQLPPRLLDVTAVAEVLGVNTRHVRRLVLERRIPFIKWGHLVRFDPVEIRDWLDRCRHQPGRVD